LIFQDFKTQFAVVENNEENRFQSKGEAFYKLWTLFNKEAPNDITPSSQDLIRELIRSVGRSKDCLIQPKQLYGPGTKFTELNFL